MPIAIDREGDIARLKEEHFRDEYELQAHLECCPYLLVTESDPDVATVKREVALPEAGSLDLLLVDAEGVPVAVEVKLQRNSQSRREVVAQAFDYVSALSDLTVDELDDQVDGALANALDELGADRDEVNLWKQCGTNLRAGRIKVVVATDQASEGLVRIVRYINDHSDLDVRLVTISKFDGGRILVPKVLVSGGIGAGRSREPAPRPRRDPRFEAAVSAYDAVAPEPLRTRGHGRIYRQIRPDDWPTLLHYEFLNCEGEDEIGLELHLECDEVKHLAESLSAYHDRELQPTLSLVWDPTWSKKRGRLYARLAKDESPDTVAEAMQALIKKTREIVERELKT